MQEGYKRLLDDDERHRPVKTSEGHNRLLDNAEQYRRGKTSATPSSLKGKDTFPSKTPVVERVSIGEGSGQGEDQAMRDPPPAFSNDDGLTSEARMEEDPPN
jgi:hypothetical protein